ncbi:MAG: UbiA family prenyltransferase [Verrucomicrobiota bacterium]
MKGIRTHLTLARASNLATTWSNVLCAFLLVGEMDYAILLPALIAVSLFYTGGMYLNDWRDVSFDAVHRIERPIPSGLISRKAVLLWVVGYFIVGLGICLIVDIQSIGWTLLLLGFIIAYDLHHKGVPWSPFTMAACRALIFPWAATLVSGGVPLIVWVAAVSSFCYTAGLSFVARGVGNPKRLLITAGIVIVAPAVYWIALLWETPNGVALFALAAFLAWSAFSLSGAFRRPPNVDFTIKNLIAGMICLDLLMVASSLWLGLPMVAIFGLLFITTLMFQTKIPST